jgi:hypothetical protein
MNSRRCYAAHMRKRSAYRDLDRKPERERDLCTDVMILLRQIFKDNISDSWDWICLTKDTYLCGNLPQS